MSGLLNSLFKNKSVINIALSQLTNHMEKDGIDVILIRRNPANQDPESPGLDIRSYSGEIAILSGEDLTNFLTLKNRAAVPADKEGVADGI